MFAKVFAFFVLCISAVNAFQNMAAGRALIKASAMSMKMDMPKAIAAIVPAMIAAPAFASVNAVTTMPLSNEVTFAAYLAVLLGTFVPVTFLIVLYSQTEARKAGAKGQK